MNDTIHPIRPGIELGSDEAQLVQFAAQIVHDHSIDNDGDAPRGVVIVVLGAGVDTVSSWHLDGLPHRYALAWAGTLLQHRAAK